MTRLISLALLCGSLLGSGALAESRLVGDLPRKDGRPLEAIAGLDSLYGDFAMPEGYRVRTILTKPEGMVGAMPAILFIQWLSCDTVELEADAQDGWSQVLRGLAQTPGFVMMRTDKPGVGDSEGPACSTLDYETELAMHRRALDALKASPDVDPRRIFVVGMSMGGNMAPLVAAGEQIAGVAIWGGGAKTWLERQLGFERRGMELGGTEPALLHQRMQAFADFYHAYLIERLTPAEIAAAEPELADVFGQLIGTGASTHFGRPFAFHQQAQDQNWAGAWARVEAPVLALYGEYDWFEDAAAHRLVADIVNRRRPGSAEFALIERTDHHFMRFETAEQAFRDEGGLVNADSVLAELHRFLLRHARR